MVAVSSLLKTNPAGGLADPGLALPAEASLAVGAAPVPSPDRLPAQGPGPDVRRQSPAHVAVLAIAVLLTSVASRVIVASLANAASHVIIASLASAASRLIVASLVSAANHASRASLVQEAAARRRANLVLFPDHVPSH